MVRIIFTLLSLGGADRHIHLPLVVISQPASESTGISAPICAGITSFMQILPPVADAAIR